MPTPKKKQAMTSSSDRRFVLKTSLSVLDDLGINLYSNSAAVVSEVVANAWDADAQNVRIEIDPTKRIVTIADDGLGMSGLDINEKFLTVGYKRREAGYSKTPSGRDVMGRKGIGKLSIFSLAHTVDIHTKSGADENAFRMILGDIRSAARKDEPYYAKAIPYDKKRSRGTKIVLRDLKTNARIGEAYLRRRLARRFTIIEPGQDFALHVNNVAVTLADREYYDKFEYLWTFGESAVSDLAVNAVETFVRTTRVVAEAEDFVVGGWIASVEKRSQLKSTDDDNLNRISLMVRKKMAHENILEEFSEAGVYSKYLIGEVSADFLDLNDKDDIATSSRQNIIEDDPRYAALKSFLKIELKNIENKWTDLRNEKGRDEALEIPAVNEWYNALKPAEQRRATRLLGKVNTLPIDDPREKQTFFKQSLLAFEIFRVKSNLEALDQLDAKELMDVSAVFESIDDIEATLYYEIVKQRIAIIDKLERLVTDNEKEKFLQEHIYDHLWLIDPSWERATETSSMEKSIKKLIDDVGAKLPKEYKDGRYDMRYRTTNGRHVLVELKRGGRTTSTDELLPQLRKYWSAMNALLRSVNSNDPFEIIVLVGKDLSDWKTDGREASRQQLQAVGARVIHYNELIARALSAYQEYLEKHKEASRLTKLLSSIDDTDFTGAKLSLPGSNKKKRARKSAARKKAAPKRPIRRKRGR